MLLFSAALICVLINFLSCKRSESQKSFALITPDDELKEVVHKAAQIAPSPRQLAWQRIEFSGFLHFGLNTFTEREWGAGKEDPALFNPTELNARQWVNVCKDAGMKQVIITAKHHDGFCLWPSQYTEYSVRKSPWRGGKGDVIRELANACKEAGLKFGVYLSPWDRHEPSYGNSPVYNKFFKNQLRELLINYGKISEVWFDGACGEGSNGKKQVYDWEGYYQLIRQLQAEAVIAIMGPDVRWVGTESGYGRETEWSVIPLSEKEREKTSKGSLDKALSIFFIPKGDRLASDLGSREKIKDAPALVWYPSEVDVSIRPGWFYHPSQDSQVKAPEKLVDIYYSSAGRNSLLLLNVPPDRRGLIPENDIKSLRQMRAILDATFRDNLALNSAVSASSFRGGNEAGFLVDGDNDTYWAAEEGAESASLEFNFGQEKTFDCALLEEYIRRGQRVEEFTLQAWDGQGWKTFARGSTIGYKRLLRFPTISTTKVRLNITQSRASPALSEFGLFKSPPSP